MVQRQAAVPTQADVAPAPQVLSCQGQPTSRHPQILLHQSSLLRFTHFFRAKSGCLRKLNISDRVAKTNGNLHLVSLRNNRQVTGSNLVPSSLLDWTVSSGVERSTAVFLFFLPTITATPIEWEPLEWYQATLTLISSHTSLPRLAAAKSLPCISPFCSRLHTRLHENIAALIVSTV